MYPSTCNSTRASSRVDTSIDVSLPTAPKSKLFAFLVGVDEYADPKLNLLGAVKDAQKIKTFLLHQQPPVSKDRIILLKNSRATADTIIEFLQYLCLSTADELQVGRGGHAKEDIPPEMRGKELPAYGDPILIYYAGHGSTLPKPEGWVSENSRIQCLSPHDARVGPNNTVINVIPDRTFGALLERLADKKGKNITVILDCCHSGSGTRNDAVPRGMEFKSVDDKELTLDPMYQRDLWASAQRGIPYMANFANTGLTSHVVLAACGPDESAYEDREKHEGRFTSAFLGVLENAGTDTLTYSELIGRLDNLPSQTPRCEGRDKHKRILFDAGLKQRDRDCYGIEPNKEPATAAPYLIRAGQINSVGKDDVFAVYRDRSTYSSGGDAVGHLVVQSVTSDSSFVSFLDNSAFDIPDIGNAVASLSRVKSPDAFRVNVKIDGGQYPELRQRVEEALKQVVQESVESINTGPSDKSAPRVARSSANKASISIAHHKDNTVYFEFESGIIYETLGLKRLGGPMKGDHTILLPALRSAAHFFRHLGSSPSPKSAHLLRQHVDVRICELDGGVEIGKDGVLFNNSRPSARFIDGKMCGLFKPTLSRVNGPKPTQTLYGVDVLNRSGVKMYVWLFYFDCSTLQIKEYYSPPVVSGDSEAPLPPFMKTPLPLNYGDSGGVPLAFEVPAGLTFDGGFLRIFLSTRNLELSTIEQDGIVTPGEAMGVLNMNQLKLAPDMWDAITIPVRLG
ncbi:unnamed protein product [Peniophora sp. CBMAI 1063]|nr:unnamed protein product [Peniophora sp. CBMAI 1063]